MCDEQSLKDWQHYLKNRPLSRREFNVLTAGAGLAVALPPLSLAQDIAAGPVAIPTPDGVADGFMVHPASGTYPGVIIWPDVLALRPAYEQMASRLAGAGYAVLVINPYYRDAKAPVVGAGASFQDEATRNSVLPFANKLNADTHFTDARACVAFLEGHDAVDTNRRMGTIGYCMGGPMVMRTAAARPDMIGAAASFHGGGLATAAGDSPHLLIPRMRADFLVAIAENDDANEPEAKHTLRESFAAAGLNAEIEVYAEALHGWCVLDHRLYHQAQAEKAWNRLLALFGKALA